MKKLALLFIGLIVISCNQAQEKSNPKGILISNINIVDVRNGVIRENRNIIIDSGKIMAIEQSVEDATKFKETIDGTGKFAVPGLAEMHAHIPSPNTSQERIEEVLFLYLSNGVTTIRGMLGHPSHLEMRSKAAAGELLSPRIFTSSPSLNGLTVRTPEEARTKVTAFQKDGYDFLKIHPGILLNVFDELVATANEVGIRFSGHVPVAVGIRHALESQYASIDHVDGYLEGLVPESENVNPAANGFFGYNFTPLADPEKIDELVAMTKANKVWIVPTQSLFERWFAPVGVEELLAQPEMKYMPKTTLANWERVKREYMADENFSPEQWKKFDEIRKRLINRLQENGYGMLLGSDAPQLFNVPGFSIHHEIQGMLDAGLTPLQILQSGTINPAIFFEKEGEFGEIGVGQSADLFIINSNPLTDLSALKEPIGVMVRGTWLSRSHIDSKLAQIAKNAEKN
ncbi:amidohydrolase family protein [Poritiphilus flavus]|uniref:Amidohydrolase family protein n=1 Tax=Poritiphilus flavus TaxID=2697053 RepID=A0A6L9EAQ2_9FLAO|nr:amidohydrolase family protein [Poritiphilus flavus]NAS11638.1 amidohydrolase family protein [Poritiphilus flavus]